MSPAAAVYVVSELNIRAQTRSTIAALHNGGHFFINGQHAPCVWFEFRSIHGQSSGRKGGPELSPACVHGRCSLFKERERSPTRGLPGDVLSCAVIQQGLFNLPRTRELRSVSVTCHAYGREPRCACAQPRIPLGCDGTTGHVRKSCCQEPNCLGHLILCERSHRVQRVVCSSSNLTWKPVGGHRGRKDFIRPVSL